MEMGIDKICRNCRLWGDHINERKADGKKYALCSSHAGSRYVDETVEDDTCGDWQPKNMLSTQELLFQIKQELTRFVIVASRLMIVEQKEMKDAINKTTEESIEEGKTESGIEEHKRVEQGAPRVVEEKKDSGRTDVGGIIKKEKKYPKKKSKKKKK